jgi:hypothetical protein
LAGKLSGEDLAGFQVVDSGFAFGAQGAGMRIINGTRIVVVFRYIARRSPNLLSQWFVM